MKNFKKILPAIGMLLVSAVMMGTSTFAWFSMNDTVKVAESSVAIMDEAGLYFQIVAGDDLFDDEAIQVVAKPKFESKDVYPVAPFSGLDEDMLVGTQLTASNKWAEIIWATAMSNNADSATKVTTYMPVTTYAKGDELVSHDDDPDWVSKNNYTLANKYRVRVNGKAGVYKAKNLTVTDVKILATDESKVAMLEGARLLIATSEHVAIYNYDGSKLVGATSPLDGATANDCLIGTEVVACNANEGYAIYVYLYFDGDNETVKETNIVNTDGFKVTFSLKVELPDA